MSFPTLVSHSREGVWPLSHWQGLYLHSMLGHPGGHVFRAVLLRVATRRQRVLAGQPPATTLFSQEHCEAASSRRDLHLSTGGTDNCLGSYPLYGYCQACGSCCNPYWIVGYCRGGREETQHSCGKTTRASALLRQAIPFPISLLRAACARRGAFARRDTLYSGPGMEFDCFATGEISILKC